MPRESDTQPTRRRGDWKKEEGIKKDVMSMKGIAVIGLARRAGSCISNPSAFLPTILHLRPETLIELFAPRATLSVISPDPWDNFLRPLAQNMPECEIVLVSALLYSLPRQSRR